MAPIGLWAWQLALTIKSKAVTQLRLRGWLGTSGLRLPKTSVAGVHGQALLKFYAILHPDNFMPPTAAGISRPGR